MINYSRLFDGMIGSILFVGVVLGLCIAGLIWVIVLLCQHVRIEWVS